MLDNNVLISRFEPDIGERIKTTNGNCKTFQHLYEKFIELGLNHSDPYGNIDTSKTQKDITNKINAFIDLTIREHEKCEICRNVEEKAQHIQRMANQDPQSSRWVNLHPGSFLYRLSNQEFQDAFSLRFSIHSVNSRKWCACESPFDSLGMHHHICKV